MTDPAATRTRHARAWWAFVPLLLAVTGVLATPLSPTTVALGALVLAATVARWAFRPVGLPRP